MALVSCVTTILSHYMNFLCERNSRKSTTFDRAKSVHTCMSEGRGREQFNQRLKEWTVVLHALNVYLPELYFLLEVNLSFHLPLVNTRRLTTIGYPQDNKIWKNDHGWCEYKISRFCKNQCKYFLVNIFAFQKWAWIVKKVTYGKHKINAVASACVLMKNRLVVCLQLHISYSHR